MNENVLREILEDELLVDDSLCINGCRNVEFKTQCLKCETTQNLEERTWDQKINGILDVYKLINDLDE